MDNSKFLKTVIIILLLINIATLAFMWTHHRGGMHGGPPGREDVAMFLSHELNFTADQEKQFRQLRDEHHEGIESLREKNRKVHDRFFDLLHANTADQQSINSMADSVAEVQKEVELLTFDHFRKVRAICTPAQQKKFDEIIDEALRMMAPKPPPH